MGRLWIRATHLDQSNYLRNQKHGAANKYVLTLFLRDSSSARPGLWKHCSRFQGPSKPCCSGFTGLDWWTSSKISSAGSVTYSALVQQMLRPNVYFNQILLLVLYNQFILTPSLTNLQPFNFTSCRKQVRIFRWMCFLPAGAYESAYFSSCLKLCLVSYLVTWLFLWKTWENNVFEYKKGVFAAKLKFCTLWKRSRCTMRYPWDITRNL